MLSQESKNGLKKGSEKCTVQLDDNICLHALIYSIDTKNYSFDISTKFRGEIVKSIIPRENVTALGLQALTAKGFPFYDTKVNKEICNAIFENEHNIACKDTYQGVGWHNVNGEFVFLHYQGVFQGKRLKMYYNGNLNIALDGSLDNAKKTFNSYVSPLIGLQAICAISLSSAIVGMIDELDLKYICHLEGESTSGKSTALMCGSWIWGDPKIGKNNITKNWNTTDNKLINSASGNHGIMLGFDELAMSKMDNTQLAYLITSGMEKQRMTDDNNIDNSFSTVFILTGEIQFKNSNYGGIAVRLIEIKNFNFTKDKETADAILNAMI